MNKYILLLLAIVTIPLVAFGEEPSNSGDLLVNMTVNPVRGIVSFEVQNRNQYPVIVNFKVSELSSDEGLKGDFIALAAQASTVKEIIFTPDLNAKYMSVHYNVEYRERNTQNLRPLHVPAQYFLNASGQWKPVSASMLNRTFIKKDLQIREENFERATIDFGGNFKGTSTLGLQDFPVEADTFGDEAPEYDRLPVTMLPPELANSLPQRALPRGRGPTVIRSENPRSLMQKMMNVLNGIHESSCSTFPNYCLEGRVRFKNSFMALPISLWGWRVEVWQANPVFKINKLVATTYTDVDGFWSAGVIFPENGNNSYYVTFKPGNRYLEIRDPSTDKIYQWGTVMTTGPNLNSVVIKSFASISGIIRSFSTANKAWIKLQAAGVNPIAKNPTIFYFPSRPSDCPGHVDAAGKPISWSCSNGETLYLAADLSSERTVGHELGHILNFMFWERFPTGSGGKHTADQCYTQGLALSEGFAEFFESWVPSESLNQVDAKYRALENYIFRCDPKTYTGSWNELAVAATFWDLYDIRVDSQLVSGSIQTDGLYFLDSAGVLAEFLEAKTADSAADFYKLVSDKYPNSKINIDGVFLLNQTDK